MTPVIDYQPPSESSRPSRWVAFFFGTAVGGVLLVSIACLLSGGGVMFPFTLLFPQLGIVAELRWQWPVWTKVGIVIAGGPGLYGLYAALLACRTKRVRTVLLIVAFHTLCAAINVWQRDAWGTWWGTLTRSY